MLAKIYRPSKNAMQSGKANARRWVLEFDSSAALAPDVLMGWTTSTDTNGQVRIHFDSREEAIDFARRRNIPHQVLEPRDPKPVLKSYSDNFAYSRREPWSH